MCKAGGGAGAAEDLTLVVGYKETSCLLTAGLFTNDKSQFMLTEFCLVTNTCCKHNKFKYMSCSNFNIRRETLCNATGI